MPESQKETVKIAAQTFVSQQMRMGVSLKEFLPVVVAVEKMEAKNSPNHRCGVYEAILPLTETGSVDRLECVRKVMRYRSRMEGYDPLESQKAFVEEYCRVEKQSPLLISRKARRDFVGLVRSAHPDVLSILNGGRTSRLFQRVTAAVCSKLGSLPVLAHGFVFGANQLPRVE